MPEPRLPDPYDGLPIVKVTAALKGAGDGLSKAMSTDAMTLHHGDKLTAVIEVGVASTTIKPLDPEDPTGPQVAVYTLQASGRATFVDAALEADVAKLLDAQAKRNDEARGRPQLPLDGDSPAALAPGDDPSVPSPGVVKAPEDDGTPTDEEGFADPAAKPAAPAKKAAKRTSKRASLSSVE